MRARFGVLGFLLALVLAQSAWAANLTVSVVDEAGNPLEARCIVRATPDTVMRWPRTQAERIYHKPSDPLRSVIWPGGWYTTGRDTLTTITDGTWYVGAWKGPEWTSAYKTVTVSGATAVTCTLRRVVDMPALGWYSADNHIHLSHPPLDYTLIASHALWLAKAEGLSVFNIPDNPKPLPAGVDAVSTASHLIRYGQELRHNKWAHLLGYHQSAFVDSWAYYTSWDPLVSLKAAQMKSLGGIAIPAHPHSQKLLNQIGGNVRARLLPVMLRKGVVDALDVYSYNNYKRGGMAFEMYYHALDCGFKVPIAAGTDAVTNYSGGAPAGGYRYYTWLGEAPLTYQAWIDSVKAGRTFATNGPLIKEFYAGSGTKVKPPGGTVALPELEPAQLSFDAEVECAYPLRRAEVIVNGAVAYRAILAGAKTWTTGFSVPNALTEPSWVALKVTGSKAGWGTAGDSLVAHSTPVYVTMAGLMPLRLNGTARFAAWCDSIRDHARANAGSDTTYCAALDSATVYFRQAFGKKNLYTVGAGGDFTTLANALASADVADRDTLALLDGTHDVEDATIRDGMTIRSFSRNATACIVRNNSTSKDMFIVAGSAKIRHLTFKQKSAWTGNLSSVYLSSTAAADTVTVTDCVFGPIGPTTASGPGISTEAIDPSHVALTVARCSFVDILSGGSAAVKYAGDKGVTLSDIKVIGCRGSGSPVALTIGSGVPGYVVERSLFANNRSTGGSGAAIGSSIATTTLASRISYCTFYNNEAVASSGVNGVIRLGAGGTYNLTIDHTIISHSDSTRALRRPGGSGRYTANYCTLFGNLLNTYYQPSGTDTLKRDPDYLSTNPASAVAFMPQSCTVDAQGSSVRKTDEVTPSYMGWINPSNIATGVPYLTLPLDGPITPTLCDEAPCVEVEWEAASAYADSYAVRWGETCGTGTYYAGLGESDTTAYLGPLAQGTTYYWQVRAQDCGGWGYWSACRYFTWPLAAKATGDRHRRGH